MHYWKYLCCLLLFPACMHSSSTHDKKEIEAALQRYDQLIKKLDADSIALLYAPDGKLGEIATGRDSIRNFLRSFKNVAVLSQVSTSDSLVIIKDTAIQKGSYHQVDIVSGKDTVNVNGTYAAKWIWLKNEGWRISEMNTTPAK